MYYYNRIGVILVDDCGAFDKMQRNIQILTKPKRKKIYETSIIGILFLYLKSHANDVCS